VNTNALTSIRELIQQDPCNRGLAADPKSNLFTACHDDFEVACRSLAGDREPFIDIVTGFFIPDGHPPGGETDGPLGALFLARALTPLGMPVTFWTDGFCRPALVAGLQACGLEDRIAVLILPKSKEPKDYLQSQCESLRQTYLIALERVGPSHSPASVDCTLREDFLRQVPAADFDRCHTMRGIDVTEFMSPAHLLFEAAAVKQSLTTIGIGDGGNEIGMGKISWDVIRRNIPGGAKIGCRVPTDHLIVAGVSNWGAYGLAAGVYALRGQPLPAELCDIERERQLLQIMVERGPLVDGVTGQQTATVDGLPFERYAEPLSRLRLSAEGQNPVPSLPP
jgi:hypothetical protein